MSVVDESLDYSIKTSSSPYYLYTRLSPVDGTNSITLDNSSGQTRTWQLPSSVFNLARSYLSLRIVPSAADAGYRNHLRVDFPTLFQNISMYSVDSGTELENLNYVSQAMNIINRYTTPEDSSRTLARRSALTASAASTIPFVVGFQSVDASNIGSTVDGNGANVLELSSTDTMRYFCAGSDNSANPVLEVRIPLARFQHSLFALDKDIFPNAITQIKFTFNPIGYLGQASNSDTDPNNAVKNLGTTPATQTVALSNMYLYLAEEKSTVHRDAIIKKTLSSGLRYLVDHLDVSQQQLTGSNQTLTYRYNRIQGSRLSHWFHTSFQTGSGSFRYVRAFNNNANQTLPWNTCSLDLDNANVFRLLTPQEVYSENAWRLRNTCITSYQGWVQNWCVPMDFRGEPSVADEDPNVMAGLDLTSEKQLQISYDVSDTGTTNRQHMAVGVIQRSIMVDKQGPVLVAL
jgi:hypothetical protein